MQDFICQEANDIINLLLVEEVRYLKVTEGGRSQMCKLLEEMRKEVAVEAEAEGKAETTIELAL